MMADPMKMFTAYQALNTAAAIVKKEKSGKINFADAAILGGELLAETLPMFNVSVIDDVGLTSRNTLMGSLALTARNRVHEKLAKAQQEETVAIAEADDD